MGISSNTGIWSIGANWPWPQAFFTTYFNLAVAVKANDNMALYELTNASDTWTATEMCEIGELSTIVSVDVADFQKYYIISVDAVDSNSNYEITRKLYAKSTLDNSVSELSTSSFPAGSTCCNFLGQFIVGNLYATESPWNTVSQCSVAWSDIGSAEMDPESYPTAGLATMPWDENGNGKVYKILPFDNFLMAYGDRGMASLVPFGEDRFTGLGVGVVEKPGILSGNSISGNEVVHGYVNANYDWCIRTKEKESVLGYRDFMQTMTNRIVVSYEGENNRFYISDGTYGFVYNGTGMYSTNQCVSSIGTYNNIICGFVKDNSDSKIRLVTTTGDFGHQSHKTVESVETGVIYDTSADEEVYGAISMKYDYKGSFAQLPWIPLNERGIFTQKATGREFKIHLRSDYETGADFRLSSLTPRIKFSDKRNIRGRLNVS